MCTLLTTKHGFYNALYSPNSQAPPVISIKIKTHILLVAIQKMESKGGDQSEEDDDGQSESDELPQFDMGKFFTDNYQIFAILSIFGAISIYIFGLKEGVDSRRPVIIGFVSSIFLLLLASLSIYKRLIEQMDGLYNLIQKLLSPPTKDSIELSIFLVAFTSLLYSLISVSSQYIGTASLLLQLVSIIMGFAVTIAPLEILEDRVGFGPDFAEPVSIKNIIIGIVQLYGLGAVLVFTAFNIIKSQKAQSLLSISVKYPFSAIISAFAVGISLVGFVYILAASLVVLQGIVKVIQAAFEHILSLLS